jgi:LysM repeat protein
MRFQLVLLLLLMLTAKPFQAQQPAHNPAGQKFLHHVEPVGLVIIESLGPGMTLYRLSRLYNVSIDSIVAANPDLNPQAIPLGFPVNIPIDAKAIASAVPQDMPEALPVYYRVQPKETLYRIAKVYLGVSPEAIVALNPRASTNISIGEVLHLGWYVPAANTMNPTDSEAMANMDSTQYKVTDYNVEYKKEGRQIREAKGLAVWKPGNDKTSYFVLHPTAIVGTFMEITNPMLHRTLTAKVAGNIPPGLYQNHVGLVVSPSVARALGVLDQQFFARWRYVE